MKCRCRDGLERWRTGLNEIKANAEIGGLEKVFALLFYSSRLVLISEWLSFCIVGAIRGKADKDKDRCITDLYVALKTIFVALSVALPLEPVSWVMRAVLSYLLAETYLSLLNVVFIGTLPQERKISIGRTLLLLIFNAVQIVLTFALFYRTPLYPDKWKAIYTSVQVFGTISFPADQAPGLATVQIALDFIFLAVVLARLVGMQKN